MILLQSFHQHTLIRLIWPITGWWEWWQSLFSATPCTLVYTDVFRGKIDGATTTCCVWNLLNGFVWLFDHKYGNQTDFITSLFLECPARGDHERFRHNLCWRCERDEITPITSLVLQSERRFSRRIITVRKKSSFWSFDRVKDREIVFNWPNHKIYKGSAKPLNYCSSK